MIPHPSTRHQCGAAILLVLCSVVLLTVLVLAFFSRSQLNRRIAFSSTNLLKTDLLARAALDLVTGELRDEIADNNFSTPLNGGDASYPLIYRPKTSTDIAPRKSGVVSATGPLVKVSAANSALRPNGTLTASSVTTDTAARNGFYLSAYRWYTSTTSSPQLGSQSTAPAWFLLTRNNGVKTPALTDAKNTQSNDYVIGRFACTVYDIDGLMDANVAGYPTLAQANAGFKSSSAYAELSALGWSSTSVSNLIAWRNPETGQDANTFNEWATGLPRTSGTTNATAIAAAHSGHLSIVYGDNAVLSRRDLLRNTLFSNSPTLFTHFSRTLNAPAFAPSTATTTNPDLANVRWTATASITHYLDNGATQTYSALAGNVFFKYRFSLAKLAWIGSDGPNASAFDSSLSAAQRTTAIRSCFGLTWDSTNARWNYAEANDSYAIKTLAEVAADGREPNFFEILKAGIASGSLGRASDNLTLARYDDQAARDGSIDLQILRIGANIIDCADSDSFPTTLALNIAGISIPVHGVEDLPYLYRLLLTNFHSHSYVDANTAKMNWATLALVPQLFNPHRSGMASSASPARIRVRIASGLIDYIFSTTYGYLANRPLARFGLNQDLSTRTPIVVENSGFEDFRSSIKTITGTEASSATTLNNLVTSPASVDSSISNLHGFIYYAYTGLPENFTCNTTVSTRFFRSNVNNLFVVTEFLDANNQWRIYDSLCGNEAFVSAGTGIGNFTSTSSYPLEFLPGFSPVSTESTSNSLVTPEGDMKIDPRTSRFGVSTGTDFDPTYDNYTTYAPGTKRSLRYNLPFGSTSSQSIYPETWSEGNKTDTRTSNPIKSAPDIDGLMRPADAWLAQNANLFRNLTDNTRRPIVLNRPFRSVAELGYVFRDTPWKTLSFFDDTSGDSALLDLFSVADESAVVAGRTRLFSNSASVYQALLSGTGQAPDGTSTLSSPSTIATAAAAYTFSSGITPELSSLLMSLNSGSAYPSSTTPVKYQRESIARTLAQSTQGRTWNLLIDVVAQSGRYVDTSASLSDFLVEGERRYWLSIAIDRYTGKVISRQLEPDYE